MNYKFRIVTTISLLWLLVLTHTSSAQHQKDAGQLRVDSLISRLRSEGVDTIGVVESMCVGCRGGRVVEDSPCAIKGILVSTYIIWKQHSVTQLLYLDNCTIKAPVLVRKDAFWKYLFSHYEQISNGKIKRFAFYDKERDGKLQTVRRSHGFHNGFVFFIAQDTIRQSYESFSMDKKADFVDMKVRNAFYRENHSSPIRKITQLLSVAITDVEKRRNK